MSSTMTLPPQTLEADYVTHPADLVKGGEVNKKYTTEDLRKAIPAHCFKPSYFWSFWYLARDILVASTFMYGAYTYIPRIEPAVARYIAWAAYSYVQGQQLTGIWVIGHEAGHSCFSTNNYLNDTVGWITHSFLLTPYFSWQSTHRRHHIYANNLIKDHNYVPPEKAKYASLLGIDTSQLEEMGEDSPIWTFLRIVLQQVIGFPWYLITNITASEGASANKRPPSKIPFGNSHFAPNSMLFRPEEWHLILASDIGVGLMLYALYHASLKFGFDTVFLLYGIPYMWVNHWIVAITYLHHTHPDLPKYEPEAWTFLKGATATVDRNLGFSGKHFLHNIADYHVIHHLFSRIPQYYAEEATKAIIPLLGDAYHADKDRTFYGGIWESFTKCQYIVPDDPAKKPADRAMWYRPGPMPPVEIRPGRGGLKAAA